MSDSLWNVSEAEALLDLVTRTRDEAASVSSALQKSKEKIDEKRRLLQALRDAASSDLSDLAGDQHVMKVMATHGSKAKTKASEIQALRLKIGKLSRGSNVKRQVFKRSKSASIKRSGLSDLADGSTSFLFGQYAKIRQHAENGDWSFMLEAAMRLAAPAGTQPEDALADSAIYAKLRETVSGAVEDPTLKARALSTLEAMRTQLAGFRRDRLAAAPAGPFSFDEYEAAVSGDLSYIASHEPNSGFVEKGLRQAGSVTATLDKFVPGWTVVFDIFAPVLPFGVALNSLLSQLPSAVGNTLKIASSGLTERRLPFQPTVGAWSGGFVTGTVERATQSAVTVIGPVKFSLSKATATAIQTNGPLSQKLVAAGIELLQNYALAVTLAATFVVGPEAEAVLVLTSAALEALKAGIGLIQTYRAAEALKKAARASYAEATRQIQALDEEIARLKAQVESARRKRQGIEAETDRLISIGEGVAAFAGTLAVLSLIGGSE